MKQQQQQKKKEIQRTIFSKQADNREIEKSGKEEGRENKTTTTHIADKNEEHN